MNRSFVLRTQDHDHVVANLSFRTWNQATTTFAKLARDYLGDHAEFRFQREALFGGYWRNAHGDVLEMR